MAAAIDFPVEYGESKIYGDGPKGYTISHRQQWVDGVYDTIETAKLALDQVAAGRWDWIENVWRGRGTDTLITMAMLRHDRNETGI